LRACEDQLEEWRKESNAVENLKKELDQKTEDAAWSAYCRFKEVGKKGLDNEDLKAIIKYLVALEAHEDNVKYSSKYNTKAKLLARLSKCHQLWTLYFSSGESDEEESEGEVGSEESDSQSGSDSEAD
jgi:hypothetical protein